MFHTKPLFLIVLLLLNPVSLLAPAKATGLFRQDAPPEKPTNTTAVVAGKTVVLNWNKPAEAPPQIKKTVIRPEGLGKQPTIDADVDTGFRIDRDLRPVVFGEQLTPTSYPATLKSVLYISYNKEFGPEFPSTIGANFKLWVFSAPTNANLLFKPPQEVKTYDVTITKEPTSTPSREFDDFNEFILPEPLVITSGSFFVCMQYVSNGTSMLSVDGSKNLNLAFDKDPPSTGILSTNGGQTWRGVDVTVPTANGTFTADFPLLGRAEVSVPAPVVTKYNVYRSLNTPVNVATAKKVGEIEADKTSLTDEPDVADGQTKYFYAVTALYADGRESGLSNEVTATPGNIDPGDQQPPKVQVVTPNGGETIEAGKTLAISWTAEDNTGIVTQSVDLSNDGGASYGTSLASGLAGNVRTFSFEIPNTQAAVSARVKVTAKDAAGNTGTDTSDANFLIKAIDLKPPVVKVLSPNGGEKLKGTSPFKITWQSTDEVGVVSQDVSFSTDGGVTFPTVVATGLTGTVQDFEYTPTQTGKIKACKVRVIARDAAGNQGADDSDGTFQLKGKK
ncbi:MAG: hypothetical protein K1Y36_00420 [Blastocatellia bacterium]|nr:hypothetical protein [Blastocatellia bacterium]